MRVLKVENSEDGIDLASANADARHETHPKRTVAKKIL